MQPLQNIKSEVSTPPRFRLRPARILRLLPFVLLAVVILIMGIFVPDFLTGQNLINVLTQSTALALMAVGVSAVLITGGIDLSIPSVMAFSGILGAMYMRDGGSPLIAGLIMVASGSVTGAVNGFAIAYLRMIPFVVTLSMMAVMGGAATGITNARSIGNLPPEFTETVLTKIDFVPLIVILLFVIVLIVQLLMRNSLFGRWLYAIGINIKTSRVSGIPTRRVLLLTYMFSGFMAGMAAIVTTARLGAAGPTLGGEGVVLDVISSAVLGGVSIYGGVGSALDALVGAILITLISNSMNMMEISYYLTLVVKGIVIILFVGLDARHRS